MLIWIKINTIILTLHLLEYWIQNGFKKSMFWNKIKLLF